MKNEMASVPMCISCGQPAKLGAHWIEVATGPNPEYIYNREGYLNTCGKCTPTEEQVRGEIEKWNPVSCLP